MNDDEDLCPLLPCKPLKGFALAIVLLQLCLCNFAIASSSDRVSIFYAATLNNSNHYQ